MTAPGTPNGQQPDGQLPDWQQQMPSSPYGQQEQNPAPKKKTGLIIGLIAGGGCLLAILLVIALIIAFAVRGGGDSESGEDTEPDVAALSPEEQATQLVTDYMAALEAGDSATAIDLMPPLEASGAEYLPAEVYDAALAAAPVGGVAIAAPVMEESGYSGTVSVDYTVGDQAATAEFTVEDYDSDDVLTLTTMGGYNDLPVSFTGLGTTLNGTEVADGTSFYLLPGAYEIGFGLETFVPASTDPLTVLTMEERVEWPEPALTEEGLTTFRGAVQTAVDACIAEKTLMGGCGMGAVPATSSDGWTMVEGTVTRTLSEDTQRNIDTMEATPEYDEPTYVRGESVGAVKTEIECTKDGQNGICELFLGGSISVPSVDMADPELPITWS